MVILVLLSGRLGKWIKYKQDLRQGEPLSPSLFILSVDVLSRIMKRVGGIELIEGIELQKKFIDILKLQFANNTLLFCTAKKQSILGAKAILLALEAASRLKTNFHKTSIICTNVGQHAAEKFALWMNCK